MYVPTGIPNRRKAILLRVLAGATRPLSYAEVAGAAGLRPIRAVATDLKHYHLWGYVRRFRAAGKFRYEITRRGRERLAYFRRQGIAP